MLIVEDGSGIANSESYASVAYADLYHLNRGNSAWSALNADKKEQALRKATDYLSAVYHEKWSGYKATYSQALDWPREEVPIKSSSIEQYLPNNIIPSEVLNACCELAFKSISATLLPDVSREVSSETVDSLSVSYFQGNVSTQNENRFTNSLLSKYLKSNGLNVSIVRA